MAFSPKQATMLRPKVRSTTLTALDTLHRPLNLVGFADMQYEILEKYDVGHVLHYVLDYVLSTLFSPNYEIFGMRINVKDLSVKFQHLL